jgi:hypothetical protein
MMSKSSKLLRVLLGAAVVAVAVPVSAQIGSFGQNKIQYRDFDWHVLRGDHVDVYYYPEAEAVARVALSYAEESYDTLSHRFNHEIGARIPLIVYASHTDFEQTNILPFVPPEGILGVTEFMKRRVTLPFRGSYSEFRHTLRHELVHVFQLSLASRLAEIHPRARGAPLPLWWTEGMAEFLSSDQETRDDMVMRDLTMRAALPTIGQLNGVGSALVYPIGGDLHRFLAGRYGAWRINLLYETAWKYSSFDGAIAGVYGVSPARLSEEWHYALRQRFYPTVAELRPLALSGRELARQALKPIPLDADLGDTEIAFLSPRSGYTNIYRKSISGLSDEQVVVAGERTPQFESLHPFSSRLDSRDGVVIFSSKYGDRDALVFFDVAEDRVVGRYQFDSLVGVISPAWAPAGDRVAFSGLTLGGISDIWVLELASGRLQRITDDRYQDLDPTWLPSGESLVFASDRTLGGADGALNLYQVRLDDGVLTALTNGRWRDEAPRWDSESGRVVFTSDRGGSFDVYSVDTLGSGRRETRVEGALFDPAPLPGDRRILTSVFTGLSWSAYLVAPDSAARAETFALDLRPIALSDPTTDDGVNWVWSELADASARSAPSRRYELEYSLDVAAGGATAAPGLGSAQGAQLVFSDLLGDHAVSMSFSMFGSARLDDLLSNINADVFYLNQSERLNWGLGAFRLSGMFIEQDFSRLYRESTAGVYGSLRYPFSRFTRLEGQARLEYSDRNDFDSRFVRGPARREGVLASNYVSLVNDNTIWVETGPIDGTRWNLTAGVVTDLTHGVFENWLGSLDVRKYLRTSLQSAVALRAYAYASEGTRPRAVAIGGSWLLRGYPRFSQAGTHAWVSNAEWRFPITNFVALGFPFGTVRFPQVQGALFVDGGQAWERGAYDSRVLGSAGIGFRSAIVPGFVFRFDVGRRFSLGASGSGPREDYFSRRFIDFFFGFNY